MNKSSSHLWKSRLARPWLFALPVVLLLTLIVVSTPGLYAAPSTPDADSTGPTTDTNADFMNYWYMTGEWIWGPVLTDPMTEPFTEGVNGQRTVQYYTKGRMEQNYPGAPVTSGLLVLEMISGRMQVGEYETESLYPCFMSSTIAGDLLTNAPTYEDLGLVIDRGECNAMAGDECAEPYRVGEMVDESIYIEGNTVYVGQSDELAAMGVMIGQYDVESGHNIPQVFLNYMASMDWMSHVGKPISEPYWVGDVTVDCVPRPVMIQAFERRILTYTNYDGVWKVEMNNTGEHYVRCRYGWFIVDDSPCGGTDEEAGADMEAHAEEASDEDAHGTVEWSYEGETGPEHWGTLSPDFALCSDGESQSPINIEPDNADKAEHELTIDYQETPVTLTNNGHSIQVNYAPGSTMSFDGSTYELLQFHFHQPSEHEVDGDLAAMEMHLVHQDEDGNLAVIGVLIEPGEANEVAENFWGQWTTEEGEAVLDDTTINIADILPEDQALYTYNGSLTTPPCSEGVHWVVLQNPIEFSQEQINAYGEILAGTNRPVQPLNGRVIEATDG